MRLTTKQRAQFFKARKVWRRIGSVPEHLLSLSQVSRLAFASVEAFDLLDALIEIDKTLTEPAARSFALRELARQAKQQR